MALFTGREGLIELPAREGLIELPAKAEIPTCSDSMFRFIINVY